MRNKIFQSQQNKKKLD